MMSRLQVGESTWGFLLFPWNLWKGLIINKHSHVTSLSCKWQPIHIKIQMFIFSKELGVLQPGCQDRLPCHHALLSVSLVASFFSSFSGTFGWHFNWEGITGHQEHPLRQNCYQKAHIEFANWCFLLFLVQFGSWVFDRIWCRTRDPSLTQKAWARKNMGKTRNPTMPNWTHFFLQQNMKTQTR